MSDGLEKHGTTISVALVAGAAAVASIDHLADVAHLAGSAGWRVWLLPAAVDGLVAASTLTLRRAHRLGAGPGWVPWASLLLGLAASVVGNVVAVHPDVLHPDHLKIAVGATPPLALALALHQALYRPTAPQPSAPLVPAPPPATAPKPAPRPSSNGAPSGRVSELLPKARRLQADHGKPLTRQALKDGLAGLDPPESAGTSTLVKLLGRLNGNGSEK